MRPKVVPLMILLPYLGTMLALVAQLDVRPTGDQEIVGSALLPPPPPLPPTTPGLATFFRGDWSWNTFCGHSLSLAGSRRAVGKLTALDMTPLGGPGH